MSPSLENGIKGTRTFKTGIRFNRVIMDISVVLRETTLTILIPLKKSSLVETEIVRVFSLRTTAITEKTRFKKNPDLQGPNTLNVSPGCIVSRKHYKRSV